MLAIEMWAHPGRPPVGNRVVDLPQIKVAVIIPAPRGCVRTESHLQGHPGCEQTLVGRADPLGCVATNGRTEAPLQSAADQVAADDRCTDRRPVVVGPPGCAMADPTGGLHATKTTTTAKRRTAVAADRQTCKWAGIPPRGLTHLRERHPHAKGIRNEVPEIEMIVARAVDPTSKRIDVGRLAT